MIQTNHLDRMAGERMLLQIVRYKPKGGWDRGRPWEKLQRVSEAGTGWIAYTTKWRSYLTLIAKNIDVIGSGSI
jgi:hypothetical protein